MSLGPNIPEKLEVSKFDRIRLQTKQAVEEYFKEPLHYLLYGSLALAVIGLFFGMNFPWQFYGLLAIFGGIKIYNNFKDHAE